MTKEEINKLKLVLENKRSDLESDLQNREGIITERCADELDQVLFNNQLDLTIRNKDRESQLLHSIRAALERINDDIFGVCLHCEEDISPKRLAAVPWSPYCIRCQERADRHKELEGDSEMFAELPA